VTSDCPQKKALTIYSILSLLHPSITNQLRKAVWGVFGANSFWGALVLGGRCVLYIHTSIYTYIYIYTYTSAYMYVYMYMYIYTHICMCAYHTNIFAYNIYTLRTDRRISYDTRCRPISCLERICASSVMSVFSRGGYVCVQCFVTCRVQSLHLIM